MQTLINKEQTPPGGFRFLPPPVREGDTPKWITAPTWTDLVRAVKKFYVANNLPIGLQFEEAIEDQLCATMPPGVCHHMSKEHRRRSGQIERSSIAKVMDVTKLLFRKLTGEKLVSKEEANAHARVCVGCFYNQAPDGCTSCNAPNRNALINSILGTTQETGYHSALQSCLLCGCELRAKVWYSPEAMRAIGKDYVDLLPEWCWVRGNT